MVMDVDNNSTKSMDCAVRINGALMNNYQNCLAILIGFVQRLEGENKRIVIKTTDNVYVQVMLTQPLSFILEPDQLIEAFGIVRGGSKFECKSFAHFGREESKEFDCESYNHLIQLCITHQQRYCIDQTDADEQQSELVFQTVDNDFDIININEQQQNSFNDNGFQH